MKKLLAIMLLLAWQGLRADDITLESSEGKKFQITREQAEKSVTLKNLIEDLKGQDLKEGPIPLPNIDGNTLEAIVECLQKPEKAEAIIKFLTYKKPGATGDRLYKFNTALIYLDISEIYEKLPAVRWLNVQLLKSMQNLQPQSRILKGHTGTVSAVGVGPNGEVVTGSWDKTARIWDRDGRLISILHGHAGAINSLAIGLNGNIVTGSSDGTARLWNSNSELLAILRGHTGAINSVAIGLNGNIVTGSRDKTARLWNSNGRLLAELVGHTDTVNSVAIDVNGNIVTGSNDKTARICNSNGRFLVELKGHTDAVNSVAIGPNGIVTGSNDKTARLWDLNGRFITEFKGHAGAVEEVLLGFNGNVFTQACDKTVRIWDSKGVPMATLGADKADVWAMAVSSDACFVAIGFNDNLARVWNSSGFQVAELKGHAGCIYAIAISPCGDFVVTASKDRTARIWYLVGDEGLVHSLHPDQLDLIAKIYEQVQKNEMLDLAESRYDSAKIRTKALFATLPARLQAVLKDFVKFH